VHRRLAFRSIVRMWFAFGCAAATLLCVADRGAAAEFRLRPQCTSGGAVVTLGDVAEIFAAEPQQVATLAAVELFPAPAASRQRFVRVRELQDLLMLRGLNLAEHSFSGASQVTVAGNEPARPEAEQPLTAAATRRANLRVHESIIRYLQQRAGGNQPWTVEIELNPAHARAVAAARSLTIAGGTAPFSGLQRFEVTVEGVERASQFTIDCQVNLPPAVAVTVHSLGRGTVIRETDVELQRDLPHEQTADGISSLEDVVGKETTRAIPAGKLVTNDSLRTPLVIRRGEIVTVYAKSSGIRIRTIARAREDGSLGDLIAVESVQDRTSYFARVNGVREVEVFAHSVQAEKVPASRTAQTIARPRVK
jgi:flagella basal body P-ring formation protein FlgA